MGGLTAVRGRPAHKVCQVPALRPACRVGDAQQWFSCCWSGGGAAVGEVAGAGGGGVRVDKVVVGAVGLAAQSTERGSSAAYVARHHVGGSDVWRDIERERWTRETEREREGDGMMGEGRDGLCAHLGWTERRDRRARHTTAVSLPVDHLPICGRVAHSGKTEHTATFLGSASRRRLQLLLSRTHMSN